MAEEQTNDFAAEFLEFSESNSQSSPTPDEGEEEEQDGAEEQEEGDEGEEEGDKEEAAAASNAKGKQKPVLEETEQEEDEAEGEEGEAVELTEREKLLAARLEALSRQQLAPMVTEVPTSSTTLEIAPQQKNFLEGITDLDDLISDPAKLNSVLQNIYNEALKEATKLSLEHVYKSLPGTVLGYVKNQVDAHTVISDFYRENKDLVPSKATMGMVANEVAVEHPEYTVIQLLEESGKRVRTMLGLKGKQPPTTTEVKKPPQKSSQKSSQKPAFAGQRSASNRVKQEDFKGLEADILELANL